MISCSPSCTCHPLALLQHGGPLLSQAQLNRAGVADMTQTIHAGEQALPKGQLQPSVWSGYHLQPHVTSLSKLSLQAVAQAPQTHAVMLRQDRFKGKTKHQENKSPHHKKGLYKFDSITPAESCSKCIFAVARRWENLSATLMKDKCYLS